MANSPNSTGSRRAGSIWGHNPGGRKKTWKPFVSRQLRRKAPREIRKALRELAK
jgi:hypothetical protein